MTSSLVLVKLFNSPKATCNLFARSYQNPTIILGEINEEASSPIRPYFNITNITNLIATFDTITLSSNPFEIRTSRIEFFAFPYRLTHLNRKRGIAPIFNLTNKTCKVSQETNKSLRDLVLNARDLIV